MGKTIRFGVSLDSDLLERFDALCEKKSYQTRSEAIRDLIRNTLVQDEWRVPARKWLARFPLSMTTIRAIWPSG